MCYIYKISVVCQSLDYLLTSYCLGSVPNVHSADTLKP